MGKRKQSSKGSLPSHPKITPQPPPSTKNVFGKLNEDVVLMLRKYLILPTDLVNLCRCNKETRKLLLPELYKHVVLTARILLANGGDTLTKLVHPRNLGRRSIRSIHLRSPLNQEDGTELMFLQAAERLLMAVPLDQLRSFR